MINFYNLQIFSCLLFFIAFASCNNSKPVLSDEYIRIGNGGGFSGQETIYTLYKNGKLEQNGKIIAKISDADLNQLVKNIEVLKLDEVNWNKPGNLYKFIEFTTNGKIQRICWDSNSNEIDNKLNLFYNHTDHLIQKSIK